MTAPVPALKVSALLKRDNLIDSLSKSVSASSRTSLLSARILSLSSKSSYIIAVIIFWISVFNICLR
jgi:hypothetical protein